MQPTREILQRELVRLRRFAYSLTCDMADADDLLHDVVVKVLEKGIPADVSPVPWLITLCKNQWIDHLRFREVRMRGAQSKVLDEPSTESAQPINQVHADRVVSFLQTLPENQRLALSMVALEGFSYAETADVLKIPVGTVMSRVARAREAMARSFGSLGEEGCGER